MNLRSLLLGSAIALGANALLVVPESEGVTVTPQGELISILPLEASAAQQQLVELTCKECPFREVREDGEVSWTDGFETSLALNFAMDAGALLVNGHQIFPPPPQTVISAVQRRIPDGQESDPISLGYAVEFMPLGVPDDAPMELSALRFTILDLDGHPVPLDTVAITMINDLRGNIYMAKTEIEDTTPNRGSWKQCRGKPKCLRKLLVERIRALFTAAKARVLGMKSKLPGCGGKRPHSAMPHPHHHPEGDFDDAFVPGHYPSTEDEEHFGMAGRPHHHHPHHMHHSGWERTVSRIIRYVVVPAVLGVLAGLTASALGMLIGQAVVFLWQRYRRTPVRENEEAGTVLEKEGLMTESSESHPPAYSDEDSREQASDMKH
ncbi:uncharacterized protein ACLA_010710 [Aspergillus clavatus NRRL 1]|uniref:DUF7728 domain-containing protein n=1 Tax=Aspergillus clavatus (strain ATCC 1007 / CBS 513.65 / DSM 816 / NCTC 3887 / NRRL 1 / QM 1276 / 107) TaxID=344612 RepID=A1CA77_ASPCL|nr:uncharacterized protein ACLA_010710 [Aspergillus clavatus NRRL 1]EAW12645.1 conserved hypothetical protein [Aspergillus clavatus NRRL 1]